MNEAVNSEWIVSAAYRVKSASADLWQRVQLFYAELLRLEGIASEESMFDREYFRQRMAEARRRRRQERQRRVAEILASRSGEIVLDQPVLLDDVPGLTDTLDRFVGSPLSPELLRSFMRRSDFDLDRYQDHILRHLRSFVTCFDEIPPLRENGRRDRVFRFIALIFLIQAGTIEVWQEGDRIRMKKNEAYEQGQGVSGTVEGLA